MVAGALWPFAVAVLAPVLRLRIGVDAAVLGVAYATYYLVASVGSGPAGRLVDGRSARWSVALLCTTGAVQLTVLASTSSWVGLVVSAAVGGVSLGISNPVTNALIAANIHRESTARWALGVKQAGIPLAVAVAGLALPSLEALLGWRGAVAALLTVPTIALAATWRVNDRRPQRGTQAAIPWTAPSARRSANRRRTGLEPYAISLGIVASGLNGYLALYVVDVLGGSNRQAGALMAAFAFAGVAGRVTWAGIAPRGAGTFRLLRGLSGAGVVALALLSATTAPIAVGLAVLVCGGTVMAWQGLGMVAVMAGGRGDIGEASGRVLRAFYAGFVVGAPVVGWLIDASGFRGAWILLVAAAVVATATVRAPATVDRRTRRNTSSGR